MPPPYAPVDKCIYCGSTRYSIDRMRLGDEHIVPLCLDGEEILPRASCKKCESKTGGVEQHLFGDHGIYRAARVVAGSGSRNKSEKTIPLFLNSEFEGGRPVAGQRVEIPADRPGPRFALLVFYREGPPVLEGRPIADAAETIIGFVDLANLNGPMSSYGMPKFSPPVFDLLKFLRFLAKLAHAQASAELGLDGFKPLLADFIRGKAAAPLGLFGNLRAPILTPDRENRSYGIQHRIETVGITQYVVVDIGVLIKASFPCYSVVAGTL